MTTTYGTTPDAEVQGDREDDDLNQSLRNIEQAVRTAQRAFDEIGRCNQLLAHAQESGEKAVQELDVVLRRREHAAVPALLDRLDALAAEVARSEADRTVVRRILFGEEEDDELPDAVGACAVPRLTADDLPRIPTVHDVEDPGDSTLEDMWERDQALASRQHEVRRERTGIAADHLRTVTARAVDSYGTPAATAALLAEARRAYELWVSCVR
ncbi:hypothetical protein [Streptomyces sp. NBC_00557]|uniref:hypothetical protein n=1 Tax=Streptomyces sp. NBC_00557 TaxID=2975776 RepID=UPI002E8219DB|nr:hypothetical protein [Streptomyces sp. NBC_00557]WUC33764.1 hypothetical protein OG956_05850 [Streptomyces sp. NBC_00557]